MDERGMWQRRSREHMIRDDAYYQRHVDHVHANPLHYGLGKRDQIGRIPRFIINITQGVYPVVWRVVLRT